MDIKEIQSLIKFVAKSGASEVKLEMEDLKITIRTGAAGSCRAQRMYSKFLWQQAPDSSAAPVAAPAAVSGS